MRCPAAPKYCRATPFSSGGSTHSRSMTRRIRSSIYCLDKAPLRSAVPTRDDLGVTGGATSKSGGSNGRSTRPLPESHNPTIASEPGGGALLPQALHQDSKQLSREPEVAARDLSHPPTAANPACQAEA